MTNHKVDYRGRIEIKTPMEEIYEKTKEEKCPHCDVWIGELHCCNWTAKDKKNNCVHKR